VGYLKQLKNCGVYNRIPFNKIQRRLRYGKKLERLFLAIFGNKNLPIALEVSLARIKRPRTGYEEEP
jgi:hypothetical protein